MKSLILFLKGLIIGLGKIIPGVSGSVLAISLGVYEEAMHRVDTLFQNFKENLFYLIPLVIGIGLAVLLGSNVILYCLNHFYLFTMIFFVGLIIGTVPGLVKKQKPKFSDWFIIALIFFVLYYFYNGLTLPEFVPNDSILSYFYIILLGMIDAATTIMPGISGTATYMVLGSYNFILTLFANPFQNLFYSILFVIGLIVGILIMIKFVNFCFKKYPHQTWNFILAFLFSSVYFLILKVIDLINGANFLSVLCLLVVSYFLINSLDS